MTGCQVAACFLVFHTALTSKNQFAMLYIKLYWLYLKKNSHPKSIRTRTHNKACKAPVCLILKRVRADQEQCKEVVRCTGGAGKSKERLCC